MKEDFNFSLPQLELSLAQLSPSLLFNISSSLFKYTCVLKISYPCSLEVPEKFVWWVVGGGGWVGVEIEFSVRL